MGFAKAEKTPICMDPSQVAARECSQSRAEALFYHRRDGPGETRRLTVYRLGPEPAFPDPRLAEPDGLLAVGGDLDAERLLTAYATGIFPWYEDPPILWFSPDPRMVLRPAELHVPRRLRRSLRGRPFELSLDRAFHEVIRACATAPRGEGRGTWITEDMIEAYGRLHDLGFAHSVEAWRDGELMGGLYGVSLGAAFFAESMFRRCSGASKVALVTLVEQLSAWGFELFDAQLPVEHLERWGARPWPRERFLTALASALERPTRRGRWELSVAPPTNP
jgi:leucyl/phenylalanyl-tRNA--protein transferase